MQSDGPNMQADLLAQLEQQLAATNARVEELERYVDGNDLRSDYRNATHMRQALEHANARADKLESTIAACKAAEFIDDGGKVRKVLGKLPITTDGFVAGIGCELWADFNPPGINAPTQCTGPGWPCVPMTRLYGSREAAEAAKGGREG